MYFGGAGRHIGVDFKGGADMLGGGFGAGSAMLSGGMGAGHDALVEALSAYKRTNIARFCEALVDPDLPFKLSVESVFRPCVDALLASSR